MKKTIIAAALGLMAFAATVAAQPPGWGYGPGYGAGYGPGRQAVEQPAGRPGEGRHGGRFCNKDNQDPAAHIAHRIERMGARLGLTDAQKTQIKTIMEEQHAKRIAQRQETHGRILAVMDEAQRAQAEQFMEHRCKGRGGRGGPGRGPGQGWGPGPGAGYGPGDGPAPNVIPAPTAAE